MTDIREIAQLGAEVLRQQADTMCHTNSADNLALITALRDTLASTQGVGIAAPQISISKRIIIVASRPSARYPHAPLMESTVMINPSFSPISDDTEKDWEGCLSIPGIRALVPRYTDIEITYTDLNDQQITARLTGFVARIFQHEFDHLQGIVYLDRVEDKLEIFAESEYFKLMNSRTQ